MGERDEGASARGGGCHPFLSLEVDRITSSVWVLLELKIIC